MVRRLTVASATVAGLTSLYYTLMYVSRWEWNRAQLTADLTVLSALVVLGVVLDGRLRDVARRIGAREAPGSAPGSAPTPAPAAPAPGSGDFRWLETPPERYGVFIPVLLGAGMVASGLAFVLERLAALFGRRTADRPAAAGEPGPELPASLLVPADTPLRAVAGPASPSAELLLRGPGAGR